MSGASEMITIENKYNSLKNQYEGKEKILKDQNFTI